MQEVIIKAKKWGNSIGLVLPADVVKAENVKPGEDLVVRIERKHNVLKEMFGALRFKKPTEQILKEVDEELKSKWDK